MVFNYLCFLNMFISLILIIDGVFCSKINTYQILIGILFFVNENIKLIIHKKMNQKHKIIFLIDLIEIFLPYQSIFFDHI